MASREMKQCSWAKTSAQYGKDSSAAERKTWGKGCRVDSEKGDVTKTLDGRCMQCVSKERREDGKVGGDALITWA
jgi:hypothetical protein